MQRNYPAKFQHTFLYDDCMMIALNSSSFITNQEKFIAKRNFLESIQPTYTHSSWQHLLNMFSTFIQHFFNIYSQFGEIGEGFEYALRERREVVLAQVSAR